MKQGMRNQERGTATALPFSSMSDEEVKGTLSRYQIGLSVDEARKIQVLIGRPPTLTEAVIWGIQGSEHSSYKSSRRFLKMFPTSGKHVILGPKEDSGIVAITDGPVGKRWGLVISHESHNHPSQIVPYEGAATGVGGTVRDVACMGARVVGCMDLLRLGDLKSPESRTIAKEVIRGIGGYGNPLGIPNLGGDTVFDSAFNSNCLVNAVAVGIVREDQIIHSFVPEEAGETGYDIIIVGKPTDRSGFGGAAFASLSIDRDKRDQNTGAVQEPNPFLERHLLASTYALFDWLAAKGQLSHVSFKDLGAGGVVCATVEQVADRGFGADIDLEAVHVSVKDLPPEVIACAETQERFCWTAHPDLTAHIIAHYNDIWDLPSVAENACASVIGKVTKSEIYRLRYKGQVVCEAKAKDITSGLQYERPTISVIHEHPEPKIIYDEDAISVHVVGYGHTPLPKNQFTIAQIFKAMLHHPNHASKSPAFRHFDKDVIGNTLIEAGEADAGVLMPLQDMESYCNSEAVGAYSDTPLPPGNSMVGVALAGDGNPRYGRVSAYLQGAMATVEAVMNVVAVGAEPRALTDCLNYGNPELPDHLFALEDGVRGIADAARGLTLDGEPIPVISGNVSLYNSLPDGTAIPPSAIVCCVGVIPDVRRAVTMQLKQPGSSLYLLGERKDECGGSAYYEVLEDLLSAPCDSLLGRNVPTPDYPALRAHIQTVQEATSQGLLLSCHDISDGGLLVALFEMTLPVRKVGGQIGVQADLASLGTTLQSDKILFSQSSGFVTEVAPEQESKLNAIAQTHHCVLWKIGTTMAESRLTVEQSGTVLLSEELTALHSLWNNGLLSALGR